MKDHSPEPMPIAAAVPSETEPRRRFFVVLRRILLGWGFGFAAVLALVVWLSPGLLVSTVLISVASGLIAVAALCPVMVSNDRRGESTLPSHRDTDQPGPSGELVAAFMIGIVVRLVGTVALFLLCRYQMGQHPEAIALLVGGWYVFLTSLEVVSLARPTTETDRSDSHHSDSHRSGTNRQIWTTG